MEYVRLGTTGLKVSRLCLGTMTYGTPKWRPWVLDEEQSPHLYHADADFTVAERAAELAARRGLKPTQIALAWMLSRPGITAPIIGASKLWQLDVRLPRSTCGWSPTRSHCSNNQTCPIVLLVTTER